MKNKKMILEGTIHVWIFIILSLTAILALFLTSFGVWWLDITNHLPMSTAIFPALAFLIGQLSEPKIAKILKIKISTGI